MVTSDFQNIAVGVATVIAAAILIGIWRLIVRFFRKALNTLDENTTAIKNLEAAVAALKANDTKMHDYELRILALEKWRVEVEVVLKRISQ